MRVTGQMELACVAALQDDAAMKKPSLTQNGGGPGSSELHNLGTADMPGGSGGAASLGRLFYFFFSSRRRHTRFDCDWSSDVCSSDLRLCTLSSRSTSTTL